MNIGKTRSLYSTIAITLIGCHFAIADDPPPPEFQWVNDEGGTFDVGSNWDPATAPGTDGIALFDLDATYTVNFSADTSTTGALISNGNVTFDLNNPGNGTFTYDVTGGDGFDVSGSSGAHLTITGGRLLASNDQAWIGRSGDGAVVVSGTGARLETPGTLRVGTGANASGSLTIEQGGVVVSDRNDFTIAAQVGGATTSEGTVVVTDPGSRWVLNHDMQHSRGDVTFQILNGGEIYHDGGSVSLSHRSNDFTGLVSGEGSLWKTNTLTTGSNAQDNNRTARLTIEDGGRIESTRVTLGNAGWMRSYALVTGEDSEWEISDTVLGLRLGGAEGTANLNRYAEINIVDGGVISVTTVQLLPGSKISGDSTMEITMVGGLVNNRGGLIAPGITADAEFGLIDTIGTLTIDGNYASESFVIDEVSHNAVIRVRIDEAGANDRFRVLGDIDLSGDLEVIVLGSPTLSVMDSFQILEWSGTLTGTFDSVDLFDPGSGLAWDLSSLYLDGSISVIPEPRTLALGFGLIALAVAALRRSRR